MSARVLSEPASSFNPAELRERALSLRVRAFTRELKLSAQQLLLNKFYRAEPPTPSPFPENDRWS